MLLCAVVYCCVLLCAVFSMTHIRVIKDDLPAVFSEDAFIEGCCIALQNFKYSVERNKTNVLFRVCKKCPNKGRVTEIHRRIQGGLGGTCPP